MLKLIPNIYQQGPNMLELCVDFISLLLETTCLHRLTASPLMAAQLGVP